MAKTANENAGAAKAFYDRILAGGGAPSKRENIERLWDVLKKLASEGETQFTLTVVGERLALAGGLKTHSLRNASGSDYRGLIELFREERKENRVGHSELDPVEAALAMISDMSVRATLRQALGEAKAVRLAHSRLQSALKKCSIAEEGSAVQPAASLPAADESKKLTPRMRSALARGMDAGRLWEKGLSVSETGAIEDATGMALFPPGFADAIYVLIEAGDPARE